jgi:hypothetical protein
VTLSQRSPMPRCGKQYPTEAAAARSKRALAGTAKPARCPLGHGHWHLDAVKTGSAAVTFSPKVLRQVDKRDGRRCQRCGVTDGLHHHHRRGKGAGGSLAAHTHCACNAVTLCFACHLWAHDEERAQAEADGFTVSQAVAEPGTVAVARFAATGWPVRQLATCDGQWATEGQAAA